MWFLVVAASKYRYGCVVCSPQPRSSSNQKTSMPTQLIQYGERVLSGPGVGKATFRLLPAALSNSLRELRIPMRVSIQTYKRIDHPACETWSLLYHSGSSGTQYIYPRQQMYVLVYTLFTTSTSRACRPTPSGSSVITLQGIVFQKFMSVGC
jgi:hypothetical protein